MFEVVLLRVKPVYSFMIVLLVVCAVCTTPALALVKMGAPFVTFDNIGYAQPFCYSDLHVVEFNSTAAAHSGSADLAIAFPQAKNSMAGRLITSPLIAQATTDSIVCDHTYYYLND